jgi:hypothetical protein
MALTNEFLSPESLVLSSRSGLNGASAGVGRIVRCKSLHNPAGDRFAIQRKQFLPRPSAGEDIIDNQQRFELN